MREFYLVVIHLGIVLMIKAVGIYGFWSPSHRP
jgi:hypothetical protein